MWYDYDYCFCGNPESCPRKDQCRRTEKKPGIHTYSLFYKEGEECEYFWEKKEKWLWNPNIKEISYVR